MAATYIAPVVEADPVASAAIASLDERLDAVESSSGSGLLVAAQRSVLSIEPFDIDLTGATVSDAGMAAFVAACAGRRGFIPDGIVRITSADVLSGGSRTVVELAPGCTVQLETASTRLGSWSGTGGDGSAKVPLTVSVAEGGTVLTFAPGAETAFAVGSQVKVASWANTDPNRTNSHPGEIGWVDTTASGTLTLKSPLVASDPARAITGAAATDTITATTTHAVTGVASTDLLTFASHGLLDGMPVVFLTLNGGAGLSTGVVYYARDTSTSSFRLAASVGGAAIDFTSDITAGSTFTTPHGLANGEIVILESLVGGTGLAANTPYYVVGATPETSTLQLALTLGGAAIDFSTDITAGRVRRQSVAYALGDAAWVELMTPLRDITICGQGTLKGTGTGNAQEGLRFTACNHVRIYDLRIEGFAADAVIFDDCVDAQMVGVHITDCDSGVPGYGTAVSNASQDVGITYCYFRRCRHAFTTGANARSGQPYRIDFAHNKIRDGVSGGDAIDTHASGLDIRILFNEVEDSALQGINVECSWATVQSNTISRAASHGITMHNETALPTRYDCSSNTVRHPGSAHNCYRFTNSTGSDGSVIRYLRFHANTAIGATTQSVNFSATGTWRWSNLTITGTVVTDQVGTNQGVFVSGANGALLDNTTINGHPSTAVGVGLTNCTGVKGGKVVVNYVALSTGKAVLMSDCVACDVDVTASLAGTVAEIASTAVGSSTRCQMRAVCADDATSGVKFASNATSCTLVQGSDLTGCATPLVPGTGTGHIFALCRPRSAHEVVATNAAITWLPGTGTEHMIHTGTLTADRTVNLSATQAYAGLFVRVTRTGSGAFNLILGTSGKSLATNTWADLKYIGGVYVVVASGTV